MQLTINNFRQLFPDKIFSLTVPWLLVKSLTFPWQLSNSLTFPGFSDKWSPCLCHVHITAYLVTNFTRLRRKKTLVNKRQRPTKETHQIHLVENAELVMVDWCIQQSELRHPTPPAESAFHLGHQHRGSLSVQQPWRTLSQQTRVWSLRWHPYESLGKWHLDNCLLPVQCATPPQEILAVIPKKFENSQFIWFIFIYLFSWTLDCPYIHYVV